MQLKDLDLLQIDDSRRLAGKTILITGAATDLGRQLCLSTSACGATVVMMDRKQRDMDPIYDEMQYSSANEPVLVPFDATGPADHFANICQVILQNMTQLHGIVHCAAASAPLTPLSHNNLDHWSNVFNTAVVAPLRLTQNLLPGLQQATQASVLFTTSAVGRKPRAFWGALGAASAALENAMATFADELDDSSVRLNSIDPGKIKTALRKKHYPAEPATGLRLVSDPVLLSHYIYLLSDASNHIRGKQITIPDMAINPSD